MRNREIIYKLTQYFLTQDPSIVAKSLACMMIDLNRLKNMHTLGLEEKVSLFARLDANLAELQRFAKKGPRGNMKLHNIESNDE